jgi:murein DD-endopeptidase MepM/ murein hydrolase activator NlpD
VVQLNDSLWKIAIKYDTTVEALVAANHIEDPDLIHPNDVVWVPVREQVAQRALAQVSSSKPVLPLRGYRGAVQEHWGGFVGSQGAADLMAAEGTRIYAVMGGRVVSSGLTEAGGWNILIQGNDGLQYYYAHMRQRALPAAGEYVVTGEHIGYVGNTGNSAAPHLHIAIGPQISVVGNAQGLRPGYGINFDVSKFLNKLL